MTKRRRAEAAELAGRLIASLGDRPVVLEALIVLAEALSQRKPKRPRRIK